MTDGGGEPATEPMEVMANTPIGFCATSCRERAGHFSPASHYAHQMVKKELTRNGKNAVRTIYFRYRCSVARTSAFARIASIRRIFWVGVNRPFSTVNGSTMACRRIRSMTDRR